jgi:cyclophilin family peptidyl-prolyl cis-trans isomerase
MRRDTLARTGALVLIALSGCRSQPAASPSGIADLSGYVVDVREGYGLSGMEIGPVFDPVRTSGIRQLRIRVASGVRSAPGTVAYIGVDPVTQIVHPGSVPVGGSASDLQGTFVRVWFRGRPRRSTPVETVAMARLVAIDSTAEAMTEPSLSASDSALVGRVLLAEDRRDSTDAALAEGARHADERIRSLARRAEVRIRDEHAAPRDSMAALPMPMTWAEPSWKAAYRGLVAPTANCDVLRAAVRDGSPWPVRLRAADLVTPTCAHDDSLAMTLRRWVDALPVDASRRVRGDVSWHAAAHGVVALARMRPGDARPRVAALATHGQWQVRAYAARAAGVLADAATLRRLARDSNANVQEAAIVSLAKVTGHADDALFLAALVGPGAQAVRAAAVALKGSPRPDVASTANAAFDRWVAHANASERDARIALLEAAGRPSTDDRPPTAIHQLPPEAVALALGADTRLRVRLAPSAGGGAFVVRLRGDAAPMMAARILALARSHYYDGTDWHRVEPDFVIQGGSAGSNEYVGYREFLRDELGTVPHLRGTVGMSTRGHDTGDAQWFVNLKDNRRLDRDYTVFAEVVEGMDVVDGILEGDTIATIEEVVPGTASHAPEPATAARHTSR